MSEKRFRHMQNKLGMQFICYDDKEILLGTFADADGVKYIVDLLNEQHEENEQLKKERELLIKSLSESSRYAVDMVLKEDFE